ncbi:MAG: 3-dehydroquinate synthase [Candidatus Omnitrophota bacterium]
MKIVKVNLKGAAYNIVIGNNIIKLLSSYITKLSIGSDAYIITNARIKNKYGFILSNSLKSAGFNVKFKLIPDSERSKSLDSLSLITRDLARFDKKRRVFVIAFGGGVIGDLAGFVASVYKRGISYLQIPTTLLAQVDSSIGGKTGVDLPQGKNLVGTFYQPGIVFSDLMFLQSLDLKQLRNGLAEVIKYGIIKDPQMFAYLEKRHQDILARKPDALEYIVERSSSIKAVIVQQDEKEKKGIRTVLNFGHTIGHAIEAAGKYKKYTHGEAVALGMLAACDLSRQLGVIADNDLPQRIEALIGIIGLPVRIKGISCDDIITAYYRDKKFTGAKNKFVLIKNLGVSRIVEDIPLAVIKKVLYSRR